MGTIQYQLLTDEPLKKWYAIYAGSLNGAELKDVVLCTEEEALETAHEYAIEDYDMYAGLHGLRDVETIMEEEEIEDEDDAWEVYVQERETWLDYHIRDVETDINEEHSDYERIQEIKQYSFDNKTV